MTKEQKALENYVRTSVWNDDEFHELWDNRNEDLELLKKALVRLAKYDEILSGPKLTTVNDKGEYELEVCAHDYSHKRTGEMIQDIADKLGSLEKIYEEDQKNA